MNLRPFQSQALTDLRRAVASGFRSPLLVSPTGSGKTIIASALIRSAVAKGRRVLFLAPRRELIYQTAEKLEASGVDHGIIMAGEPSMDFAPVQVACVPTLYARGVQQGGWLPPADLIVVDEAHLSISESTCRVLAEYPDAVKIGLTATPARADGRGLGLVYDEMVFAPSVAALTAQKFLVPARYFSASKPDLEGVKVQAGDYNAKQLATRVEPLLGDVVTNWLRIARDRKTVVFCVNVAHSKAVCESFLASGIRAEQLDGKTPNDERKAILERLATGETQVLANCDVCTYGWDSPSISCVVLARPTKSIARYLQMVGRVLRPSAGKADALVIDHANAVDTLGFVDEDQPWSLDAKGKLQDRAKATREKSKITCADCSMIYSGQRVCPFCGHEPAPSKGQDVEVLDVELAEMDRQKRKRNREWTRAEKARFFGELLSVCDEKGFKAGWAANKYRERMGVWPNAHKGQGPLPVSDETRSWLRHKQIQWAKSKAKRPELMAA